MKYLVGQLLEFSDLFRSVHQQILFTSKASIDGYRCSGWERFGRVARQQILNPLPCSKESTLERADFTLQLLLCGTAEKGREMFIIFFFSSYCQLLSPQF